MKFKVFLLKFKLEETKLKRVNEKIRALTACSEVTLEVVHDVNSFGLQLDALEGAVNSVCNELLQSEPLPDEFDECVFSTRHEDFFALLSDTRRLVSSFLARHIVQDQPPPSSNGPAVNVRLPKINLPIFSGQWEEWQMFSQLYQASIHNNHSLAAVEKFQYLTGCLKGEALQLVRNLPITSENYSVAWGLLTNQYQNIRKLTTLHINRILDLPLANMANLKSVRHLVNTFNENARALEGLGCEVTTDNPVLVTILLRKLDMEMRTKFESSRVGHNDTMPKVSELIEFLQSRVATMDCAVDGVTRSSLGLGQGSHRTTQIKQGHNSQFQKSVFVSSSEPRVSKPCVLCNESSHSIYRCPEFLNSSATDRQTIARNRKLCFNCLGVAHVLSACSSAQNCFRCKQRHHTLLHTDGRSDNESNPHSSEGSVDVPEPFVGVSSAHAHTSVLLSTAVVTVFGADNRPHVMRCLLDNAAQASFITEAAANVLSLQVTKVKERVCGLSQGTVNLKGALECRIQSSVESNCTFSHNLFVISKITSNLPRAAVDPRVRTRLGSLPLADPLFDKPGPVDILLGADVYARVCLGGRLELGSHMPVVLESKLGWMLLGEYPESRAASDKGLVSMFVGIENSLDTILKQFWEAEEPPKAAVKQPEADFCETHFMKTHSRDDSGRYKVRLPIKPNAQPLGDSQVISERRYYCLERKLSCQPTMRAMYKEFMDDYVTSGHMECYIPSQHLLNGKGPPICFIPHHGVLKMASSTTKLRVVFDGSAKTSNGLSLNDILLPGPKLQNDISDVILRFRLYSVAFSCDIKQMYRQILVHEDDRSYQLILWRDDPSLPLTTFQLNTVTYGLSPSPFLAIRTLHQLASDEGFKYPLAQNALIHHIFVDDIVTGASSVEEANTLKNQLIQLLSLGGFELRKWSSNHSQLLTDLPECHREKPKTLDFSSGHVVNILGLQWNPERDCFSYRLCINAGVPTKRFVLAQIARIYDPMGWLSPVIVWAKILMQWLWTQGLGWDDPIPSPNKDKWNQFIDDLPRLETISLPRFICPEVDSVELHGFSDASERAYAAVVYLRSNDSQGNVCVHLLLAKSRVAPLKQVSLPRLELCGAHLLAKLIYYCHAFLAQHLNVVSVNAWTDSSIVLSWLKTQPYLLKTYVANRVAQIQDWVPPQSWKHIASCENPADCATRGVLPTDFLTLKMWWHGPEWLVDPPDRWPLSTVNQTASEIPELKTSPLVLVNTHEPPGELPVLRKLSSWSKLVRVFAYVMRFINNCRRQSHARGTLSSAELAQATSYVCKCLQRICFSKDLKLICEGKLCSTRLQRLAPFFDQQGVLRAGGRLSNAHVDFSAKHPIILPKAHPAVEALVDHYHLKYLHAAPQLLQSLLCHRYWVLSARSLIRSRVFKCVRCFRCRPTNQPPLMGELPAERVTPAGVFQRAGVDYAGPISTRLNKLRRCTTQKAYLSIFVCFATKAVHIEVVSDLTADSFIAALTRFVSRRGLCASLYSDCGTNFVGASRQIHSSFTQLLKSPLLENFSVAHSIDFKFLPPASPHQGGLWEAAVKSAKYHLKRTIGDQLLTLEELTTLCTRVEAVLNSRPLTPLSSDPCDVAALTPGHFLIGRPLVSAPQPYADDDGGLCLSRRWKMVCALANQFWNRWYREYLQQLQPRGKWLARQPGLAVGDLVLVGEERVPPLSWCLARVSKLYPGQDGIVRVVDVRTQKGQLRRPAHKLYLLPSQ